MSRGGIRTGSGRPALPKSERRRSISHKLHPAAHQSLKEIAKKANLSMSRVIEWFALSLDATAARQECIDKAKVFNVPKGLIVEESEARKVPDLERVCTEPWYTD